MAHLDDGADQTQAKHETKQCTDNCSAQMIQHNANIITNDCKLRYNKNKRDESAAAEAVLGQTVTAIALFCPR